MKNILLGALPAALIGLALPFAAMAADPVTLKCVTATSGILQSHTQGEIYLHIEPDESTGTFTYRVLSITGAHKSLVRDITCINSNCVSTMSNATYVLVNSTKPNFYLNVSIDRTNGLFHAEEGTATLGIWSKMSEDGTCTPGEVPAALF